MANRESSDDLSSLASGILRGQVVPVDAPVEPELYNALLTSAKRLAGSVMSQDEHAGPRVATEPGELAKLIVREALYPLEEIDGFDPEAAERNVQKCLDENMAGTHAYDLLAETEKANVQTTDTLISMVAATVLAKLIEDEGGGRSNITFGPQDMDAMHREYEMTATRDGLLTTVSIRPRPETDKSETTQAGSLMEQAEEAGKALPQVESAVHDRPVWAIRYYASHGGPYLARMHDQRDAEIHLSDYETEGAAAPVVENRMCLHPECPVDQCNQRK